MFATGCRTAHLALPPMVISETNWPSITNFPELAEYPIVDIHSHTFNARYLPIENIARARRYDTLPLGLGYLFPDKWVVHLARAIVKRTNLSAANNTPALAATPSNPTDPDRKDSDPNDVRQAAAVEKEIIAAKVSREKAIAPDIRPTADADEESSAVPIQGIPRKPTDKKLNKAASRLFKAEQVGKASGKPKTIDTPESSLWRFIYILTSGENRIRRLLVEQEFPEVDLFVHHMMDLGPVYGQSPKGNQFMDFATNQLPRSEFFDGKSDGKFLRFVAFSPYRATNSFEEAWQPIERALTNGAWGVKIYPPSGYRPIGNDIPRKPWCSSILREQWDSRYARMTDDKLDAIMLQFFERCLEKDIPIFAHCSYGEFQAAKGYGPRDANPKYWLRLFKKHPHLEKLRLCLGHAGGSDYWLGFGDFMGWGADILTLCTNYPNVYCEFGAMDGILGKEKEQLNSVYFANRMLDCFRKTDGHFARKVMYGSDWFMPMAADPRTNYLNAYREAFLSPELRDHYKDFFCRNALNYLQLSEQRVDNDNSLSPTAKARLRELLGKAQR